MLKQNTAEDCYNEGNSLLDQGSYMEAISTYKRVLEIDPSYTDVYVNSGLALTILEEYQKAEEILQKGKEIDPQHSLAEYSQIDMSALHVVFEKAVEKFNKSIEMDLGVLKMHLKLGETLYAMGARMGKEETMRELHEKLVLLQGEVILPKVIEEQNGLDSTNNLRGSLSDLKVQRQSKSRTMQPLIL